jgi:hypothetical protein
MSQPDKLLVKILLGNSDANIPYVILKYQMGALDDNTL